MSKTVFSQTPSPTAPLPIILKPPIMKEAAFQKAFADTPEFAGYKLGVPQGHPCAGAVLTGANIRPSNLFFHALFEGTGIKTTMPGSKELFAFLTPHEEIREFIKERAEQDPDGVVAFSANNVAGKVKVHGNTIEVNDLSELYGHETYEMSYKEIQQTLDSQKIYVSSLLPKDFYHDLKKAMKHDKMVILPGKDRNPQRLKDLKKNHVGAFLAKAKADPQKFGFASAQDFEALMDMTLYQVGAMVVKKENFRVFVDGNGHIIPRKADQNDAICLLNACGIRGIHSSKTPDDPNKAIMTETFKTSFIAAENGIVIFPAVGMGVWRGDPNLYWRAFLDAVVDQGKELELICVNPGHQKTASGTYKGCSGEEFEKILQEYLAHYQNQPEACANLKKIVNLHKDKKDVVQLARELKLAYPQKNVSLFNASDPDVTLGYHVGEYVNNMPHTITTEENYTAMGTNGLCFEGITNIHKNTHRTMQT